MQPGAQDLRVTSCQALDARQALLLHLPEKQGQACHGRGGGVLFLGRQPPPPQQVVISRPQKQGF